MNLSLHSLLSTFYLVPGMHFMPRKTLLFVVQYKHIPKHSNKVYLGQIFTKLLRSFSYVVIDLILNVPSVQNIYF